MRAMRKLLPLCLLAALSCQKRVFIHPEDGSLEATKKEITIDVPSESDILIVVDNSGSMEKHISDTRRDIVNFTRELSSLGNKFRIAVVTSDNPANDPSDPLCGSDGKSPPDVDAKNNGRCGKFIKPKNRTENFLDSANFTAEQLAIRFGEYLTVGSTINTQGSAVEQSLKGAYMALDPKNTAEGGANAGFFREDALLLIVFLTDESDCSYPTDADGALFPSVGNNAGLQCYANTAALETAQNWAQKVTERRGDKRRIAVGLISSAVRDTNGVVRSAPCVTVNGAPSEQCDCFLNNGGDFCKFTRKMTAQAGLCTGNGCCTALSNDRLETFAREFKSERDSICQDNFGETLIKLARLADQQCFSLDKVPLDGNPDNIQLELKRVGTEVFVPVPRVDAGDADGWYYDGDGIPLVCLQGAFKRKVGDTISVLNVSGAAGAFSSSGTR